MRKPLETVDNIVKSKLDGYKESPSYILWFRIKNIKGNSWNRLIALAIIPVMLGLLLIISNQDKEQITETTSKIKLGSTKNNNDNNHEPISTNEHSNSKEIIDLTPINQVTYSSFNYDSSEPIIEIPKNSIVTSHNSDQLHTIKKIDSKEVSILQEEDTLLKKYVSNDKFGGVIITNPDRKFSISFEVGLYGSLFRESNCNDKPSSCYSAVKNPISKNYYYSILFDYHYRSLSFTTGIGVKEFSQSFSYNYADVVVDPDGGYYDIDTLFINLVDEDLNVVREIIGYNYQWVDEYMDVLYSDGFSHQLRYVNIPIRVAYRFNVGKVAVSPELGLSFDFLSKYSGNIPVFDYPEVRFEPLTTDQLNKLLINSEFGLNLLYYITDHYSIYMYPGFNAVITPAYKNGFPIKENKFNYNLKIGLRYNF